MKQLAEDIQLDLKIEDLITNGFPLPRWGWPTPPPYNGSTGTERIKGWQKVSIAQRLGYLERPRWCSACGTETAAHRHAEFYMRVMTAKPVCRSCHIRIHRRFGNPAGWKAFVAGLDPDNWTRALLTEQINRVDAIRLSADPDWLAALRAFGEARRAGP